jgi:hypothetical protein
MTTTRRNRRLALLLGGLLSLGIVGSAGTALADIDDFTANPCPGPVSCDIPPGPGDFTDEVPEPDPEPDPDLPEGQPEADDTLPPAPTGDVVVADANFTG